MREAFRGGWPFRHPPNMDFELNWRSPQADGLVLWLPLGTSRPTGTSHIDRVRKISFVEGDASWSVDGDRGWSMLFDDAASEYLGASAAPVTAVPLTMSCWFKTDDASNFGVLVSIANSSATNEMFAMEIASWATSITAWTESSAAAGRALDVGNIINNTWHHACSVFTAPALRAAFLDGGNKGTSVTNVTPSGLDRIGIGVRYDLTPVNYMTGNIADVRIYNRALSDAEIYRHYANSWELYAPRIRLWPSFLDDAGTIYYQSVGGILSFPSGTLVKSANKVVTGTLTSVGDSTKATKKNFAGALASVSDFAKIVKKNLAGTLINTGDLIKEARKSLAGMLGSTGTIARKTFKSFSGTLNFVGVVQAIKSAGQTFYVVVSGALGSSGLAIKRTNKIVAGILSSAGTIQRNISKIVAGTISFVGLTQKKASKSFVGTISFVGSIASRLVDLTIKLASTVASFLKRLATRTQSSRSSTETFFARDSTETWG